MLTPVGETPFGAGWDGDGSDKITVTFFKYIPKFIIRNDFLTEIVTRLAIGFNSLHDNISLLQFINLAGKGGQKHAEETHLLISFNESDSVLQAAINNTLAIHQARGREDGILADVKRITNDPSATIEYFSGEDTGWWLEKTYADLDEDGTVDLSETVTALDNTAFLRIHADNNARRTDADIVTKCQREIIPINIASEIILNEVILS